MLSSLRLSDVDAFFLALHGGIGENGTLQAFLDVAEIHILTTVGKDMVRLY
jgi:D-alanine-D-alanine ligase-like ATP-grasp enzyme